MMLQVAISILMFFFAKNAFAQDPTSLADALFDTGQYPQARSEYEKLFRIASEHWQEDFLLYNIGTASLANGEWDKAIEQFNAISLGNDPNPLLLRSIEFNKAIALYQKAQSLFGQAASYQENFLDGLIETSQLLEEALVSTELVKNTDCLIDQVSGNPQCDLDPKLQLLENKIKQLWGKIEKARYEYQSLHFTLSQNARQLYLQVNELLKQLPILKSENLTKEMLDKYLKMLSVHANEVFGFWALVSRQVNATELPKEVKKHFSDAARYYLLTLPLWQKNSIEEGKGLLELSKQSLYQFILAITSKNSSEEMLQIILLAYSEAINEFPLLESTIDTLSELLGEAKKLNLNQNQDIQDAEMFLQEVLKALKTKNSIEAKAFLLVSYQRIYHLLASLQPNKTPRESLEKSIEQEEILLELTSLIDQIDDDERNPAFYDEESKTQKKTAQSSTQFILLVLKAEEKNYENACQTKPWDKVIPLFHEGYNSSLKANKLMASPADQWDSIVQAQKDTIIYWKEALKNLESEKKQPEQQSSSKPQGENMEDLLQNLQEMLEQDQSFNPENVVPVQTKVEKPW